MESYKDAVVRIWDQGEASNSIQIRKGVKHRCSLIPLLFNIWFDSIFRFIMRQENHKYAYSTEQFPFNIIQAFTDDIILIANSVEGIKN
jgi:hypothetical protein